MEVTVPVDEFGCCIRCGTNLSSIRPHYPNLSNEALSNEVLGIRRPCDVKSKLPQTYAVGNLYTLIKRPCDVYDTFTPLSPLEKAAYQFHYLQWILHTKVNRIMQYWTWRHGYDKIIRKYYRQSIKEQ